MPKTRDAFALRDFDEQRVLPRVFGAESPQCTDQCTDVEILADYQAYARNENDDSIDETTYALAVAMIAVNQYQTRLTRHVGKIMSYSLRLIENFDIDEKIQAKVRRAKILAAKYKKILGLVQTLKKKIHELILEFEETRESKLRKRFAQRLRQARKKAAMTQQDLANKIQMSQGGYTQYELARRDPSIPTLIKLSRILNCSADWLLGLTP